MMQAQSIPYRGNPRKAALIAAAVAGGVGTLTMAVPTASAQTEFQISTSGATALGAFTRMNGSATSPTASSINRGPMALGQPSLTIGGTTYTLPPSGVQYLGIANAAAGGAVTGEPSTSQDRLLYFYRESGSIQGILDLADSNGLLVANGGTPLRPADPSGNLFLWINGNRYTSPNSTGAFNSGRSIGQNYITYPSNPTSPQTGQPNVRIAWSDVRFEQAFAIGGAASPNATPTSAGYGQGQGNIGGTNFQRLRNATAITGGIDPTTTRLRNQTVAVVPFNLVANPGTGLAQVTKEEGKWLQATGRLANGANFNSITREIGSGTRNQGALNLGLDPSWAGGERDRRALASYSTTDADGNPITINVGDEADPALSLTGSSVQDSNENRIGPTARFSDKISGSSGVRATVVASRMGVGILSAGDSRDNAAGSALATVKDTTASPLRALKIDFGNGHGFVQATAANVTEGRYEMWSGAQAVTVAPYANPTANDTGVNAYRPINGDTNDANVANPTSNAEPGVHRKFLDNITNSVGTLSGTSPNITPADFIISSSFIPPQIMGVTKTFDGGALSTRTRSTTDPDGGGPLVSEQQLWNNTVPSGPLFNNTNWGDPSTTNGGLSTNAVKYRIFASANNALNATANRTVDVNARNNLAGDFNGDTVRDLNDVPAMALAAASPSTYLATPASGDPNGRNYNGTAVNSTSTGTNASAADGLIVLSDFNSNGNVTVDQNNSSFATTGIERADVKYFLYGATIDTGAQSTNAAVNQNKRENLVRTGQLRKNAAILQFNTELDVLVDNGQAGDIPGFTQAQADGLKFARFDANQDDLTTRVDGFVIEQFFGKDYTNITDVLSTNVNLIAIEMTDNNAINRLDFDALATHLITAGGLTPGDVNLDGFTDSGDIIAVLNNFGFEADDVLLSKWTIGDITNGLGTSADGFVDSTDLIAVLNDFGAEASFAAALEAYERYDLDSYGIAVSGESFVAVPEPGAIGLVGLAGLAALGRRRRRSRSA